MYARRGRGGPSKATPASVQCQKCLKRGHYSYECKAAPQERPYVPRPSRTQQLLDPKLRPQLTNDAPDSFQKKTGIADAELAKKAAQREKDQKSMQDSDSGSEFDDGGAARADCRGGRRTSRRRRSRSYDSVSSAPARSASPPPRRASISPERERSQSPKRRSRSPRSARSYSGSEVSRSPSPRPSQWDDRRREYRGESRGSSRSPRRDRIPSRNSERRSLSPPGAPEPGPRQGGDHYSSDEEPRARQPRGGYRDDDVQSARPRETRLRDSRSPGRGTPVDTRGGQDGEPVGRQYRDRRDPRDERDGWRGSPPRRAPPPRSPPRERSLSPFSKRRALTQAGNGRG